jgi:hypothetical protein
MASRKPGGRINPEEDAYNLCLPWATHLVDTRAEPEWFQAHREVVQDVAKVIGLSTKSFVDALMTIVLACDLAEGEPVFLQPKEISKKLGRLRSHLRKAHRYLLALERASRPEALKLQLLSAEIDPDGSLSWRGVLDPYQELAGSILLFLERSDGVTPGRGKRPKVMRYAVERLEWFIKRHNADLSVKEREDLIAQLLDPVRERHGQLSRASSAESDDVSGYKHLRLRRGKRQSRPPSRKKSTKRG